MTKMALHSRYLPLADIILTVRSDKASEFWGRLKSPCPLSVGQLYRSPHYLAAAAVGSRIRVGAAPPRR